MIKADDFVETEDYDPKEDKLVSTKEKYTNFQELSKKVQILRETVDDIAEILRANNITKVETKEAPFFDEDRVYDELEEEADEEHK